MFQMIKQRKLRDVLVIYTAVEAFRHIGWMLFYEQFVENSRQEINIGFIFYSAAILVTALIGPAIYHKYSKQGKAVKLPYVFIVAISCAFLMRIFQLLSGLTGAYVFMILWTIAVMVCICICYLKILENIPTKQLGCFFGIAYFADALIVSFIEYFTGTPAYYVTSILVGIVLCGVATLVILRKQEIVEEDNMKQLSSDQEEWNPSKRFIQTAMSLIIIYVLIAGLMDNLYFFDDWMNLPYVGLFTLPMMGVMYFVSGVLFDKLSLRITIPFAIVCICIAQTMIVFMIDGKFAYSYSFFSYLGSTFLQLAVVIILVIYARIHQNSSRTIVFGEGIFYGGLCIGSIFFLFIKQSAYRYVMGGILLAEIACLIVMIELIILYEKHKHQKEIDQYEAARVAFEERIAITDCLVPETSQLQVESLNIRFTRKEKELMPFIMSSLTAEEIAEQCNLSASTVRFHIKNILHKTSASNRRELIRIIGEQNL